MTTNKATNRQKTGNDLATELLLSYAFIHTFSIFNCSNSMQHNKVNQQVTFVCIVFEIWRLFTQRHVGKAFS